MHSRPLAAPLVALSLVAVACGGEEGDPADTVAASDDGGDSTEVPSNWPERIVFGFVPSQEQTNLRDDIRPFIDVLEASLGIEVTGEVTTDYTGLITAMGAGQADLGAFGPFAYVLGKDNFDNIEALIQSIRFDSATYHGQYFTDDPSICTEPPVEGTALANVDGKIVQVDAVNAVALQVGVGVDDAGNKVLGDETDGGDAISPGWSCIGNLSKVDGKTIAFTTETSTSGYLFAALELAEIGIDPETDVTRIFTGGHDAAITAVYNGAAEIGLSYDDARREIRETNPDVGEKLIVFSITDEIPNDVVAVRSDLPDDLKQAVYDAVESYVETGDGESVFGWTAIRPPVESDFDIVRRAATELDLTRPPG